MKPIVSLHLGDTYDLRRKGDMKKHKELDTEQRNRETLE